MTSPARVRAELDTQAATYRALLVPGGWGAGGEDTLRRVIGMAPLASLGLLELLDEARATRARTLALLDLVLAAPPGVRVWTFGEEVGPPLYLLALRGRLDRLTAAVRAARLEPGTPDG